MRGAVRVKIEISFGVCNEEKGFRVYTKSFQSISLTMLILF